jgi:hypothetical protein
MIVVYMETSFASVAATNFAYVLLFLEHEVVVFRSNPIDSEEPSVSLLLFLLWSF